MDKLLALTYFLYQSDTVCCDTHACADVEGAELQSEAFLEPDTCGTGSDNENVCSLQDTVCLPLLDVILPSCLLQPTNNVHDEAATNALTHMTHRPGQTDKLIKYCRTLFV